MSQSLDVSFTDVEPLDLELSPGSKVGEYQIEEKIGQGGMGVVYRAIQPVIGKRVAVKVLHAAYAADAEAVERFVREARAVNAIGHRGIIDIFGFGRLQNGLHYFVMEYLDGHSLETEMHQLGRPCSADEVQTYLRPVFSALAAAHESGIIHRDLKPDNIFLVRDAEGLHVKLLDFGLAKLTDERATLKTQTGMPMGTVYYMAPEQCRGKAVDARSDVYALGVILYRMVTCQYPFDGESMADVIASHLFTTPKPPSSYGKVPPALENAILKALEKDAALRPQSTSELWEMLAGRAGRLTPPPRVQPAPASPYSSTSAPIAASPVPAVPLELATPPRPVPRNMQSLSSYYAQPGRTVPAFRRNASAMGGFLRRSVFAAAFIIAAIYVWRAIVHLTPSERSQLLARAASQVERATSVVKAELSKVTSAPSAPTGHRSALRAANFAILQLEILPEDSVVRIDGKLAPTSGDVSLRAGSHRLKITRDGYRSYDEEVLIVSGDRVIVAVQLQSAPAPSRRTRAR